MFVTRPKRSKLFTRNQLSEGIPRHGQVSLVHGSQSVYILLLLKRGQNQMLEVILELHFGMQAIIQMTRMELLSEAVMDSVSETLDRNEYLGYISSQFLGQANTLSCSQCKIAKMKCP